MSKIMNLSNNHILTNAIIPSNKYKADFLPDASSFTLNIPFSPIISQNA